LNRSGVFQNSFHEIPFALVSQAKVTELLGIPVKLNAYSGGKPITIPPANRSGVGAKRRRDVRGENGSVRAKGQQFLAPPQHAVSAGARTASRAESVKQRK
jgi:hypothetical protein